MPELGLDFVDHRLDVVVMLVSDIVTLCKHEMVMAVSAKMLVV